jgi:hypothetical protein
VLYDDDDDDDDIALTQLVVRKATLKATCMEELFATQLM